MNIERVYGILRDITLAMSKVDATIKPLPEKMVSDTPLSTLGLDIVTLPKIIANLQSRFQGRDLGTREIFLNETLNRMAIGQLVEILAGSLRTESQDAIVVYVDDEEENLFVFKRKFGKKLNLVTFSKPIEALDYIQKTSNVGLVITDEVMPKMTGNVLCDEVKKSKPNLKFILITGNPDQDDNLLYNSLRQNRFYEFFHKPVDFDKEGEQYLNMIQGLLDFEW